MTANAPPKVFISATSADLRSVRQLVKEALLDIDCHPVEQTNFPPDWRSVEKLLHEKIAGCAALVHIAGLRHGYEPDPTTLPLGLPRSYTQLEYDYGCRLQDERGDARFRVYVFVCPEDFDYDTGAGPEPAEKQTLQHAHRAALLEDPRRYEKPVNTQELKERILALREPLLALQQAHAEVMSEVQVALTRVNDGIADIKQTLLLDAPRIRSHLREASEQTLAADLATAETQALSEARERHREAAKAAHETRVLRIDDVVASFATLAGQAEIDPIVREMSRILQEEGVDQALVYAERRRPDILKAVDVSLAAHQEKIRAQLKPLFNAAQLHAARGDDNAARQGYTELLARQPDWPVLLAAFGWYLYDRSIQARDHGSLRAAQSDAAVCLDLARRWQRVVPDSLPALKLLGAANTVVGDGFSQSGENGAAGNALKHYQAALAYDETRYKASPDDADVARDASVSFNKLGDFLAARGQSGDAPLALSYYQRGLETRERLLADNPDSARAARDVSVSLNKFGDFLAARGQPGDAAQALSYYQRDLKISKRLLATNPDSAQAARDVSVSLTKLGDFLAARGQSGDAPRALSYYQRGLETHERLLAANPDSAQAARDVSVSLNKLGDFLADRGQSGDAPQALSYYQRGLETRERLLTANPDSAQASRDVSVSLNKLGNFLAARGQPGDAPQALSYFQRDLEISERLLAANPDSAQAAYDVLVSLERLAKDEGNRAELAKQALALQTRALDLARSLHARNPDSAYYGRTLVVSLYLAAEYAKAVGDGALARQHRADCLATLDALVKAGIELDASTRELHVELKGSRTSP